MMIRLKKLYWGLRAVVLKPFLGSIGLPSYIGPTLFIIRPRRLFLGTRVRIMPGLRAEVHGNGSITIGDNVQIAQGFHVAAMSDLTIGTGTAISPFVTITDIDHSFSEVGVPILEQTDTTTPTRVGDNCFIGRNAILQPGTTLGDGCIVGANSVLRGEFAPHSVIVGSPARVVRRYNQDTQTWERVSKESSGA